MSDEAALLAAICAEPEEDTPRLAYADWLDEHDQAERAEFIRAQVELARLPPEDDDAEMAARRAVLDRRCKVLLKQHRKEWWKRRGKTTRAVRALRFGYRFVRGFPDFPSGYAPDFFAAGDAFFAHHPVGEVRVTEGAGHAPDPSWLGQFLQQAWLPRVRTLALEGYPYHPPDWSSVFRAEKLANVERLSLTRGRIGPPLVAPGDFLPQLRSLTVEEWRNEPGRIRNLLDAIPHGRITDLRIGYSRWTADDVAAVLDCPKLAWLDRFDMAPERSGADRARGQAAALLRRLGAAPLWKRLRSANLDWTWGELAQHLPELPPAPALRAVKFSGSTATTPAEMRAIAASPFLRTVTRISFGSWSGVENLRALLASPHLGNLADLDLLNCGLGPQGAKLLAESPAAANLVRLDLRYCGVRKAGAEALAASPVLNRVQYLDVSDNGLRPPTVALLRARFGDALIV